MDDERERTAATQDERAGAYGAGIDGGGLWMTTVKQAYEDAANVFEIYADDQIAAKRWQTTAKSKRDCDIRAETYRQCALELREAVKND